MYLLINLLMLENSHFTSFEDDNFFLISSHKFALHLNIPMMKNFFSNSYAIKSATYCYKNQLISAVIELL